jgi:hypothetical protein
MTDFVVNLTRFAGAKLGSFSERGLFGASTIICKVEPDNWEIAQT